MTSIRGRDPARPSSEIGGNSMPEEHSKGLDDQVAFVGSMPNASSGGLASNTTLNGVSATRANELNPASITTSLMGDSPACAPRASPTSCDKEHEVHCSVEKA
jgi:hypothetical protein